LIALRPTALIRTLPTSINLPPVITLEEVSVASP
jgi:hypothetical protein